MSGRDEFRRFIKGESSETQEADPPRKRNRRLTSCIFLLILQIILLLVWGAFFFVLGLNVQYSQIPPQVLEALVKINVELPQSASQSLSSESNTATTSQGIVLKVENISPLTEADVAIGSLPSEGKFVRVDVTIENGSSKPIVNLIEISLRDAQNRIFQRSDYRDVGFMLKSPLLVTPETINPGFVGRRSYLYHLPDDVSQIVITLGYKSPTDNLSEEFDFFFNL